MKILFATTNPAKVRFYATRLKEHGIDLVTLKDLNITEEIEETGSIPLENAIIKAKAYGKISGLPTIAMDDGLYLNNVPDEIQPGTHVRRINGKRLNDVEVINYYISLVNKYGENGELKCHFTKAASLFYNENLQVFEKDAERILVNRRSKVIDEGYPLASIQIIPVFNKFKSELTPEEEDATVAIDQKPILDFFLDAIKIIENKEK